MLYAARLGLPWLVAAPVAGEDPVVAVPAADVDDHPITPPSEGYLRTMARGLHESHGWTSSQIGDYLAQFPGTAGVWRPESIEDLAA
jgi:hypothetical protein